MKDDLNKGKDQKRQDQNPNQRPGQPGQQRQDQQRPGQPGQPGQQRQDQQRPGQNPNQPKDKGKGDKGGNW